jgi:hypothetical protein
VSVLALLYFGWLAVTVFMSICYGGPDDEGQP